MRGLAHSAPAAGSIEEVAGVLGTWMGVVPLGARRAQRQR